VICCTVAEGRDGFARKKKEGDMGGGGVFLYSSWSFPHWLSSRPPFPIEPHPCFLRRGHASTPRSRRGIRSASNRRRRHHRAGLITAGVSPPCRNLVPLLPRKPRRNNFAQVGSGHEQCTVRRGRVIPRRTSNFIIQYVRLLH
jgi:hypothetical protein